MVSVLRWPGNARRCRSCAAANGGPRDDRHEDDGSLADESASAKRARAAATVSSIQVLTSRDGGSPRTERELLSGRTRLSSVLGRERSGHRPEVLRIPRPALVGREKHRVVVSNFEVLADAPRRGRSNPGFGPPMRGVLRARDAPPPRLEAQPASRAKNKERSNYAGRVARPEAPGDRRASESCRGRRQSEPPRAVRRVGRPTITFEPRSRSSGTATSAQPPQAYNLAERARRGRNVTASGMIPRRPLLCPKTPHHPDGVRIDPPMSLPILPPVSTAAPAAAASPRRFPRRPLQIPRMFVVPKIRVARRHVARERSRTFRIPKNKHRPSPLISANQTA